MNDDFCQESIDYMENTDINYRKSRGQYFTPKKVREELIKLLPKNIANPLVLDPACGSGEFLLTAKNYFKNPRLEGWEIDEKLVNISKNIIPSANIKLMDSLKASIVPKYDFIIGNPPYFEMKPDEELKEKYKKIINGRNNIFSLFVYLGLSLLKDNGYLAYVIPPSMNNGAYFSKLRKFIVENSDIESLKILDANLFHKAQQLIMIMVLKKTKNSGKYLFSVDGIQIFSENWQYLKESFKDKKSLHDLNFSVRTGRVVWNQNKDKLTDDNSKTPIIWSSNIGQGGELILNNKANRLQYINLPNPNIGPAIVVNRVTGASSSAKIRAAIIPKGFKFFAENHCNVIFPPIERPLLDNTKEKTKITLKQILNQLNSKEKLKIIQSLTGNTQISKNELEKLFPLDLV